MTTPPPNSVSVSQETYERLVAIGMEIGTLDISEVVAYLLKRDPRYEEVMEVIRLEDVTPDADGEPV